MKTRSSSVNKDQSTTPSRVAMKEMLTRPKQIISKRQSKRKVAPAVNIKRKSAKKSSANGPSNLKQSTSVSPNAELAEKPIWRTLLHNGVIFPPSYRPHGIPLKYDGEDIKLGPLAEEVASMFAMVDERHYVSEPLFRRNFFEGFRRALKKEQSPALKIVRNFEMCDFSMIKMHVAKYGLRHEKATAEYNSLRKRCRYAIVDGLQHYVHGYDVAQPAILIGRKERSGMVRDRVFPEDVTINIGEESPDPPCPMEGRQWGKVVHEQNESWVASWIDTSYEDEDYAELSGKRVEMMDRKPTPASLFLEEINNL